MGSDEGSILSPFPSHVATGSNIRENEGCETLGVTGPSSHRVKINALLYPVQMNNTTILWVGMGVWALQRRTNGDHCAPDGMLFFGWFVASLELPWTIFLSSGVVVCVCVYVWCRHGDTILGVYTIELLRLSSLFSRELSLLKSFQKPARLVTVSGASCRKVGKLLSSGWYVSVRDGQRK